MCGTHGIVDGRSDEETQAFGYVTGKQSDEHELNESDPLDWLCGHEVHDSQEQQPEQYLNKNDGRNAALDSCRVSSSPGSFSLTMLGKDVMVDAIKYDLRLYQWLKYSRRSSLISVGTKHKVHNLNRFEHRFMGNAHPGGGERTYTVPGKENGSRNYVSGSRKRYRNGRSVLTCKHRPHDVCVNEEHDHADAKLEVLERPAAVLTDSEVNASQK